MSEDKDRKGEMLSKIAELFIGKAIRDLTEADAPVVNILLWGDYLGWDETGRICRKG